MSITALIPILGEVIDRVIPDADKKLEIKQELNQIADKEAQREHEALIAQTEVNKVEAQHSAIFVAGWRPAVGWSCVAGLLYTIILAPAVGLPIAETAFLRDVLLGMLGINVAARSIEKVKGVAQNTLTGAAPKMIDAPVKPKKKKSGLEKLWPF